LTEVFFATLHVALVDQSLVIALRCSTLYDGVDSGRDLAF